MSGETQDPGETVRVSSGDPWLGRVLKNKYRLERLLGTGGIGAVYAARQLLMGTWHAVKVLHAPSGAQPEVIDRFREEARIGTQLRHPRIVAVTDFDLEGGTFFLVMDLIESVTLAQRLRQAPEGAGAQIEPWARDIAAALDYAHAQGVVHRDLKPSNILVRDQDQAALLTDFGISRWLSSVGATQAGTTLGTYAYMSPEQCMGEERAIDSRSDVYSFAALLFELECGRPPFGTGQEAMHGHLHQPVPSVRKFRANNPAAEQLVGVFARGLAKSPDQRPQSARQLVEEFLAGRSGLSPTLGPPDMTTVGAPSRITVFLADDNLIVREGVKALLGMADDLEIVGVGGDYEELVQGASAVAPQVVVTDIRMPPTFTNEGIEAAREVRKRHPGTSIVILSQFEEPEYAISLLSEGAAGCAYLLKDRVAQGDQLVRAIREVSSGGSMLDPRIVEAMTRPVTDSAGLSQTEAALLQMVAEGKPVKAIAVVQKVPPAMVADAVDKLFLTLAQEATAGTRGALERLTMLHQAIVSREEQGHELSRLLPGGIVEDVLREGKRPGETEKLTVTVLMSDVRGYSSIAEDADPSVLALQLNRHRAEVNREIVDEGGTVMQFVGDAVMAVFGAPIPQEDHAERAVRAALRVHSAQAAVNLQWEADGLPAFGLGIGVSTGEVAAVLLGSEERLEYSVVGDSVNLAQRIQQWAAAGETVLSEATFKALSSPPQAERLEPQLLKGRHAPVSAYKVAAGVAVGPGTG